MSNEFDIILGIDIRLSFTKLYNKHVCEYCMKKYNDMKTSFFGSEDWKKHAK